MTVQGNRLTGFATEDLIQGHPGPLALDIPEGLVNATHGVMHDRPGPPVATGESRLPDVLDVVRVPPDDHRLQVVLDGRDNRKRSLGECCASPPIEARVRRFDLHDHQADAVRRGADHLHIRDLDVGHRARWFPRDVDLGLEIGVHALRWRASGGWCHGLSLHRWCRADRPNFGRKHPPVWEGSTGDHPPEFGVSSGLGDLRNLRDRVFLFFHDLPDTVE